MSGPPKPLYPDGREVGLLTARADGLLIGPVLRVLSIVVLALLAGLVAASGLAFDEAATIAQSHCSGRRYLVCELDNLLIRQIPPSAVSIVAWLSKVGVFALLLGLIGGLLKPWLVRRRSS